MPLERPEVANERGLLGLELGEIDESLSFLRLAAERFSNSARIRYALARAERAKVQASGVISDDLAAAWGRLARVDDRLRAVRLLGEGRTYLASHEGAVEAKASDCFGELGWRIQKILESHREHEAQEGKDRLPFMVEWAQELRSHLFGDAVVRGVVDLPDLDILRQRIAEHATELDLQEESLTYRSSAV
ncbi:MAG: hypothetical protein HC897_07435 [Thermoanaerobaculia bacterium]|nr:hypothetical protein [Thermoanaerobaculia bacterium]